MRRVSGLVILLALGLAGQTPKLIEFEVASVKPGRPRRPEDGGATGGPGTSSPNRFIEKNVTMRLLLGRAFGAIDAWTQISGPGWIDSEWYSIEATMPAATTPQEFRQMLQKLLIDRFKLVLRRDTKPLPVYELVLGKSGHKLRPSSDIATNDTRGAPKDAPLNFPQRMSGGGGGVSVGIEFESGHPVQYLTFRRQEGLGSLVGNLQGFTHRPVADKTGLSGKYDFDLYFEPVQLPGSIVDAVQQQLGLTLVDTKIPLETIVVVSGDRAPAEN
jgi:uncharacterized protein (TIGR03435 family)